VINGFARTLVDHWADLPDEDRLEMLAAVIRGGERLTRMVDDLHTASRLESGAVDLHPSRLDLAAVVAEVVRDLTGADGATVEVRADGEVVALADRGRVEQMLGNYLANALRYGRPPITVTVGLTADGAEVRVTDAGPGVTGDLRDRLFQRFARGARTDGTGLGLFIVRELARRQGGDAWYEDAPGGGARFALRLPVPDP
jgi:signal transduction histidine kinase